MADRDVVASVHELRDSVVVWNLTNNRLEVFDDALKETCRYQLPSDNPTHE